MLNDSNTSNSKPVKSSGNKCSRAGYMIMLCCVLALGNSVYQGFCEYKDNCNQISALRQLNN
ncbi:hypothetical protein LMH73_011655 [Vibrio splendidus]|nr:hypothetical protein [Vibrio splendidus]MCC4883049.1 hypothetical protein [Vibrio splendidus]